MPTNATSSRRPAAPRLVAEPTLPAVRVIPFDAVFRLAELRAVLGLPMTTLKREARAGRLRVSRRGGWYWTTGRWVHEWLEGGEVTKERPEAGN